MAVAPVSSYAAPSLLAPIRQTPSATQAPPLPSSFGATPLQAGVTQTSFSGTSDAKQPAHQPEQQQFGTLCPCCPGIGDLLLIGGALLATAVVGAGVVAFMGGRAVVKAIGNIFGNGAKQAAQAID